MKHITVAWLAKYGKDEYAVLYDLYMYMDDLESERHSFSDMYYEFFRHCEMMLGLEPRPSLDDMCFEGQEAEDARLAEEAARKEFLTPECQEAMQ